jgi:hypothetical protein
VSFCFYKKIFNGCSLVWWLLLFSPAMLYISCSGSPKNNTPGNKNHDYKDSIKGKPPASFSDTVIIGYPAAVFFNPDSIQLEKIKVVTDSMIFESNLHDCFYQMRYSRITLKKYFHKIKIIAVTNARYLLFKKAGGGNECIDLNTKNDPCGIIVFDGKKPPRLVDMTNIESELGFYFTK